ncbi:DUF1800 domain-containing protein [Caulobacter hibisci]|uniref:DUF1800 domain-containing protein n=1 Tax=Caulobacter hibisci TaxID=2035993 RepID=A0ABS0SRW0_9CAUL|nr:DUF1800 domain-containing protein [Caulobacter hibisci]MBI1682309.1 DUF1800 domain-containing protein [Caulobacter hibisci]
MRTRLLASSAGIALALILSACGGGGGGGSSSSESGSPTTPTTPTPTPTTPVAPAVITAAEASRLAKQASFGPTPALIEQIVAAKSASAWIDQQLALSDSTYADIAAKPVKSTHCTDQNLTGTDLSYCNRDNFGAMPVAMRFYSNAMGKDDQLRQRVAFALSQIVVASDLEVHTTAGLATFNQILLANAFGNYRDILAQATLNPFMGNYLDMVDSSKSAPNENYARELMQLFSVGTVMLNMDGTAKTGSDGATIATYSNADVKDVARALTGWTYPKLEAGGDWTKIDYSKPMIVISTRFDTGAKTFLGATIPAGATQQANVDAVVDAVFKHANTAPFVSKRLIQQLVTANPSPAYVGRVAAVFADNGSGVRGDMKAVIKAILTDTEARGSSTTPGKVKEPVLFLTSLARGMGLKSDGYAFYYRDTTLGQMPFRSPSVFNFYPYDFPLPLGSGQVSPVSKLMTTSTIIARHNLAWDWTMGGEQTRTEFQVQSSISGSTGLQTAWTDWDALAADESKLLDRLDLVFLNGTMTSAQRSALSAAMATVKNTDAAAQAHKRAQVALYIVATAPNFQVDR